VLTEFLTTGRYDRKRTFFKTTSPSMDILVSSNLERLLYYVCGHEHTVQYMKELAENGEYTITPEELAEIQSVFTGFYASDDEGADAIREVFESDHYLMDTHTSVAWACLRKCKPSGNASVVLSTASPYKFSRAVLEALGAEVSPSDEENMNKCREITGAPIPEGLAGIFSRAIKYQDVISIDEMMDFVIGKSK
jgi:threonine synthase